MLVPGTAILPTPVVAVAYCFSLIYLFLGISIVSDIFMSSIEKITAQTRIVQIKDAHGQVVKEKRVSVWNPTVANLTLMALGSSAPEILLSVIETVMNLGACPGELGASTIVGSAAFNLLVISGLSIYAVNEKNDTDEDRDSTVPVGVKKINDLGVFAITTFSSLFAYIWMYLCLRDQKVSIIEAVLTFLYFFILIFLAWQADRYKANKDKLLNPDNDDDWPVVECQAIDIYRELIREKKGEASDHPDDVSRRDKMKTFLKETMKTDQIERVSLQELKTAIEGEGMINRIKYRRQVGSYMSGKRPVIAKGEKVVQVLVHADHMDEKLKNEFFGFQCLHYSVSEASGSLQIHILNKKGVPGKVFVRTIDAEAKAGDDYEKVEETLEFKSGETTKFIEVKINDDDNWEPDEDFFVQLYDADSRQELEGQDTRTRVTIIDDDKPGQICFQESKAIKAVASEGVAEIQIIRKNGSDGVVKVDYETIQLDQTEHTATPGVDYTPGQGTLVFQQGETQQTINIKILDRPDQDVRDESFGIQLSNVTPQGAKLSKKAFQIVNIVTDVESKKKAEAYAQLLRKIEEEEEATWGSQFITACMLHPTKNEDGDIQDIEAFDGFLHLLTIGWKLFFSLIPPPHYAGGWACFFISLAFIGIITAVVGEFANLFGCVLGIKPAVTAITFVALGTSLPDTFASMAAAQAEKYADSAVGNVTGSNSVNVFLGLGLPWLIASIWQDGESGEDYFVPAGSLGFSVVVFIVVALCCIVVLVVRRQLVEGELGGSSAGRTASCIGLVSLWFIYIIMSIL